MNHGAPSQSSIGVILPAAGSGRRFGAGKNKLFTELSAPSLLPKTGIKWHGSAKMPIWFLSLIRLREHARVSRIILPVSPTDFSYFSIDHGAVLDELQVEIVLGGQTRTESVLNGLEPLQDDDSIGFVAIHDAARPLVRQKDLTAVFDRATQTGAAILASPVAATVKQTMDSGQSCQTLDRSTLWLAQTPQVFRKDVLTLAYEKHRGRPATDDAELVQRIGIDVALVPGSTDNLKITLADDLVVAQAILDSFNPIPVGRPPETDASRTASPPGSN